MDRFKRLFLHTLFWVSAVFFLSAFLGKEAESFKDTLMLVVVLVPIAMLTSYTFNYFLFPNYLFQQNYFRFTLYSFFVVVLSVYLQMLIILLFFMFQANYQIDRMIPGSTNAINLGVAMYFVVFLSTLIFLVKRWSAPAEERDEEPVLQFRSDRKQIRLPLIEVLYVESLDNYVKVKTSDKEFITKERISELETRLNGRFLRIHRSFLVNKKHIESYTRENLMVRGEELPISRTYKKGVMEELNVEKG